MSAARIDLPTFEEAVEGVAGLLDHGIRAEMFMLHDGYLVGRLTVDPDVALAALSRRFPDG